MQIGKFNTQKDGVFIIAELSANHNGSLQIALDTIKAAKEAGANAVKLQTYTADTLTIDCDREDFILKGGLWDGQKLYDLYKKAYTPWEWHKELFSYARELGLEVFSTPFDKSAVDFLEQFDPVAYKVASFEITDYELVEYIASKKRPMIVSTGVATLEDIKAVVEICKGVPLILLKCTSQYPAPLEEANLRTITDMKERFGVEVGFSDHTLGIEAPVVAVSLGAKLIEKHFIMDRSIGGADSGFSLDKEEFREMVLAVRKAEKLLGKVDYEPKSGRKWARSLYVVKPIKKGEIITKEHIRAIRPGYGLHPKYLSRVIGSKATRDYQYGEPFVW